MGDKDHIKKIVAEPCPKCNGPRESSKVNTSGNSHIYVNFGGRIRNRDVHRLYAIGCKNCSFVEIYAD